MTTLLTEISIKWSAEDIDDRAQKLEVLLTVDQISNILHDLQKNHDACYGINWDTIDNAILNHRD